MWPTIFPAGSRTHTGPQASATIRAWSAVSSTSGMVAVLSRLCSLSFSTHCTLPPLTLSMPDILRIQRPRLVHIAGPLDDRPPIGKDGELEAVGGEFQHEAVV